MYKFYLLLATALPLTQAARLFLSTTDGWDNSNIRSLFNLLDATTDHELILCAPDLQSSRRTRPIFEQLEEEPMDEDERDERDERDAALLIEHEELTFHDHDLLTDDEFQWSDNDDSSPEGWDPLHNKERQMQPREYWPWGFNISDFRLNYVPFRHGMFFAVREGVERLTHLYQQRAGERPTRIEENSKRPIPRHPDLYLFGPKNSSSFVDDQRTDKALTTVRSLASSQHRPTIYFAGPSGPYVNSTLYSPPLVSKIYAELAKTITQALTGHEGHKYLYRNTFLRVNFPRVDTTYQRCTDVSQFKFILTSHSKDDQTYRHNEKWCGEPGFPYEKAVVEREDGCYVAMTLEDISKRSKREPQPQKNARKHIIDRLSSLWTCLPEALKEPGGSSS
ncbi:hypothetical protein BDU57DRAFT_597071 [Ampelomyces quisqualis]|uniref:Survival protein SurE-like phosphatase/nucleotidase domain-containing protein n=1 Tax=Ampelomyces quisqualis TaxID=50730 RepID=A0A6A5QG56_AMPQU|nr:hypothetical protein BDU57DRAFT_597071 [Ampelomyces quisqualis]